jgi:RNA polymerase sigma factor (sigma-70 family)
MTIDEFTEHRDLLTGVAYRILGSAADAEDVVQEAWLRWSQVAADELISPKAYLVRMTTNLAIDRLRRARARREAYVGPWLPEPVATSPDGEERAELADTLELALLVVLETLSPLERAVFVLREAFGYSHAEIAEVLGRTEPAVRQLARRARDHVRERRPRFDVDRRERRRVTERFIAACAEGDAQVVLHEAHHTLGGRARSTPSPYITNEGTHVFYADGLPWRWMAGRGLVRPYARVRPGHLTRMRFRRDGRLTGRPPLALMKMIARRGMKAPVGEDFGSWAARRFGPEAARAAAGLLGVVTYEADPGRLSAAFVWERFRRATAPRYPSVRYVIGGWGRVADGRTGALDLPGTSWRDRPAVHRGDGVWLAGDQVAVPGLLSEVSVNSALAAARAALAATRVGQTPITGRSGSRTPAA